MFHLLGHALFDGAQRVVGAGPGRLVLEGKGAGRVREHFPRVQDAGRIKGLLERALGVDVRIRKHHAHGFHFFEADPVLARDGAAQRHAGLHDLPAGLVHPLELIRVARVEQDQGVQVPVAGVKDVAVLEAVALHDLGDLRQGIGQQGARHRAVIDQVVRRQPRHRSEGAAPSFPEAAALLGAGGIPDLAAAVGRADLADAAGLLFQALCRPLHFDDQDRRGVPGVAAGDAVLDRPDDRGIHHLEGRRHDPGGDDAGHRTGRVIDGVVDHELGHHLFRLGHDAHGDLGHHGQGALAADEQRPQIVSGRVDVCSAQAQ